MKQVFTSQKNTRHMVRYGMAIGFTAVLVFCVVFSTLTAAATTASYDTDFGKNGQLAFAAGQDFVITSNVENTVTKKLYVVGYLHDHASPTDHRETTWQGLAVMSHDTNRLNTSGIVTTPVARFNESSIPVFYPTAAAVQPDGKLVIAGQWGADRNWSNGVMLLRLNTNLSLDTTFGTDGLVQTTDHETIRGFVVDSTTGELYVHQWSDGYTYVQRYRANGNLDQEYGSNAKATVLCPGGALSTSSSYSANIVLLGGKVVAPASCSPSDGANTTLTRFTAAGQPDSTFAADGSRSFPQQQGDTSSLLAQIVIQGSGLLLSFSEGQATGGMPIQTSKLTRLTSTGAIDTSFGTSGSLVNTATDSLRVVISKAGAVMTLGLELPAGSFYSRQLVMRQYTAAGQLDESFATGGAYTVYSGTNLMPVVTGAGNFTKVAPFIQTDGKLVLSSDAMVRPDPNSDWYMGASLVRLKLPDSVYTSPAPELPPPTPPEKRVLMGMGDSYISGEGMGASYYTLTTQKLAYDPSNGCHLSHEAYPYLLGRQLSYDEYYSVACSGAMTKHFLTSAQVKGDPRPPLDAILNQPLPGYIPQLDYLDHYNPGTVVVSVGGNDVGFKEIILNCLAPGTCYANQSERKALLQTMYSKHNALTAVYTQILRNPAVKKLYVVGYPQVIRANVKCGLGINVMMNSEETQFANGVISHLNATIRNAAQSVGAYYVDNEDAFGDHRLCDTSPTRAMNGLLGERIADAAVESFHPTAYGHQLIANTVRAKTSDLAAAMPNPNNAGALSVSASDTFITQAYNDGDTSVQRIVYETMTGSRVGVGNVTLRIRIVGLNPITKVSLWVHSTPTHLGEATADADGVLDTTVALPSTVGAGEHTLHVYAEDSEGNMTDYRQSLTVDPPAGGVAATVPTSGVHQGLTSAPPFMRTPISVAALTGNSISLVSDNISVVSAENIVDRERDATAEAAKRFRDTSTEARKRSDTKKHALAGWLVPLYAVVLFGGGIWLWHRLRSTQS